MTSIANMIKRIGGLSGTKDVTEWESDFINSIIERTGNGTSTTNLTGKQVEIIQSIFKKHFAD